MCSPWRTSMVSGCAWFLQGSFSERGLGKLCIIKSHLIPVFSQEFHLISFFWPGIPACVLQKEGNTHCPALVALWHWLQESCLCLSVPQQQSDSSRWTSVHVGVYIEILSFFCFSHWEVDGRLGWTTLPPSTWVWNGVPKALVTQILAFCRYFCLEEGVWPWQSPLWAVNQGAVSHRRGDLNTQRRWHWCSSPGTAICGKWSHPSLWNRLEISTTPPVNSSGAAGAFASHVGRVLCLPTKNLCTHTVGCFLCTAARNLSHLFLNHRGGLFAEQQGLKYKSGQVLNRLMFLKFVMLSVIRRLVWDKIFWSSERFKVILYLSC